MHLHSRLRDHVPVRVVPAITGMSAAWTVTDIPITWGDDVLTVLPGTMPEAELARRMADADAIVVMKIGRNLPKVRAALGRGQARPRVARRMREHGGRARGAPDGGRGGHRPLLLHRHRPRAGAAAVTGWLAIAGLGPGSDMLVTPEVTAALAEATDVVGYIPYVRRVAPREGLTLHETDNREELARARHALEMAAKGRRVVVVSSGDPGVFAMASAVFEALETGRRSGARSTSASFPASPPCSPPPPARARRSATTSARSTSRTTSSRGRSSPAA
jgi:precorrin-2 C20-methyltransferase / precorrin-3B C17-methyltransferase